MKHLTKYIFKPSFCKIIIKNNNDSNLISQTSQIKPQTQMVRLSKWISNQSICSRREAQYIINLGLVRINGKRVFQNQLIPYQADFKAYTPLGLQVKKPVTKLWMMNKPRGYICSHRDPQNRPTVYSLLPSYFSNFGHIISVGRLDFNSQGLLLLTNDSTLKQLLQHPDADLQRFYRVKVHGRVTPQKLKKMSAPMQIKGKQYGPLKVDVNRQLSTNVWLNVSMKTGKNREIRRIMQKCDLQVNKLIRRGYGHYQLKNLPVRQLVQLQISQGLTRKLTKTKAQKLANKSKTFIQIDIRQKALQYARLQASKRSIAQKQNDKKLEMNKQIQDQSDDE